MIQVAVLGREAILLYTWLLEVREDKCKNWVLLGDRIERENYKDARYSKTQF